MRRLTKAVSLVLFACALLLSLPSMASADSFLVVNQDNGALIFNVAFETGFSPISQTFTIGDFSVVMYGAVFENAEDGSAVMSSSVKVTNNGTATHSLQLIQGNNGFTLPTGPVLNIEGGMGGSVTRGTVTATFQSFADTGQIVLPYVLSSYGFTNGVQTATVTGSTFDTGSAEGTFTRLGAPYTMATAVTLTLSGGGVANFSSHAVATTAANVPEPSSLLLLGSGLIGLAGLRFRRK